MLLNTNHKPVLVIEIEQKRTNYSRPGSIVSTFYVIVMLLIKLEFCCYSHKLGGLERCFPDVFTMFVLMLQYKMLSEFPCWVIIFLNSLLRSLWFYLTMSQYIQSTGADIGCPPKMFLLIQLSLNTWATKEISTFSCAVLTG